jgi:hypothetical protein
MLGRWPLALVRSVDHRIRRKLRISDISMAIALLAVIRELRGAPGGSMRARPRMIRGSSKFGPGPLNPVYGVLAKRIRPAVYGG